jgi:regulatory protein
MDEKFYTKALKYLALRPRSEKEVRDNLLKFKALEEQVNIIVELLKKQKFLDDVSFAKWWVEQRSNFRQKGWKIVELELKQKGISKEIIKNLESEMKNGTLEGVKGELEQAKELVEKNIRKYQGLTRQELYQKLGGFLGRRGFNYDIVKACIDEVLEK